MRPEMAPGLVRIGSVKSECVKFVVAHDCKGGAGIDHGPDDLERFPDLGAAVNEVAEENSLALGVLVDALVLGIAQLPEEPLEGVSVAVYVADEVVTQELVPLSDFAGAVSVAKCLHSR